jgi:hypothetical protein
MFRKNLLPPATGQKSEGNNVNLEVAVINVGHWSPSVEK